MGKIVGCFGVRGLVKVRPATHTPERLLKLPRVFLGPVPETTRMYEVESAERRSSIVVMKFSVVSDRSGAESLIGMYLFIDDHEVQAPADGSYLIHEIIGCEVWSQEEKLIGHVEDVYSFPAQDVWVIRRGERLHMVPAVKEYIRSVDTKQRKIIIEVIEGLLE